MVRNYVRKSDRKLLSPKRLQKAKRMAAEGISIREIASKLNVNETTIRRRLKCGSVATSLGRFQSTFTRKQETEIVSFLEGMDDRFFGLPKRMLGGLVYQFAEQNGLPHSFNKKTRKAGWDWIESFMERNHLSLRSPQKTSVARVMGFNKPQVDVFLDQFAQLMVSSGVLNNAAQIYNMDESGFSTVPDDREKVISTTNKKHVGKISSAERGVLVTVIEAISAAGSVVAPAFVFPRIRRNEAFLRGMIDEYKTCQLYCSESGYSNSDLFLKWMQHFIKEVRPNKDFPVILLLDNHISHLNYDALCLAKENFVHVLTIPPHSSHEVQPLDVGFFSPLKTYWNQSVNDWLMLHPGETVSIYEFCQIFKPAFKKVLHPDYGKKAFEKVGLCPFDRNKFTETMYLPSTVTDQNPNLDNKDENSGMDGIYPLPVSEIDIDPQQAPEEVVETTEVTPKDIYSDPIPGTSHQNVSEMDEQIILDVPIINEVDLDKELRNKLVEFHSISDPTKVVKMLDIYSYPKIKKPKKRSGRSVQATIVTSTPELVRIKNKKEETETKKSLIKERREKRDQKKLEAAKQLIFGEANKIKEKKKAEKKIEKKNPKRPRLKKGKLTNAEKEKPDAGNKKLDKEKENHDIDCPGCNITFEDPPTEDWIQCFTCKSWWHEKCTNYEMIGNFVSDFCS